MRFFSPQRGGWWPSVLWFHWKWSKKEGLNFNRLVFFLKGKVLESFLTASWAAGKGSAGKGSIDRDRTVVWWILASTGGPAAPHEETGANRNPRGCWGSGRCAGSGKVRIRKSRPGNKGENSGWGICHREDTKQVGEFDLEGMGGPREPEAGQTEALGGHRLKVEWLEFKYAAEGSLWASRSPTPHWWNVNAAPAQGFSAFLILCLLGLSYDVSIPSSVALFHGSTHPYLVYSLSSWISSMPKKSLSLWPHELRDLSWGCLTHCIVQSPPQKKTGITKQNSYSQINTGNHF